MIQTFHKARKFDQLLEKISLFIASQEIHYSLENATFLSWPFLNT